MLTKINNYSISDQSASALMVTEDTQRIGLMRFNMLNDTNTAVPGNMLGSIVEVNGALYRNVTGDEVCTYHDAAGNEYPAADAPDGTLYIVMIPNDDTCKCVLKTLATTGLYYDNVRCGYYETSTQNRILGRCSKSGSAFIQKRLYLFNNNTADDTILIYQDGAVIHGSLLGYADGETDSKLFLDTTHTYDTGELTGTIVITHPCHYRLVTDIRGEGNIGHAYRYHYKLKFRPVANVGSDTVPEIADYAYVPADATSGSRQVINYGSLMPGTYIMSHNFTKRERSTGSYWSVNNHGTLWIASTLYIGNVYGHTSGRIL